MARTMYSSSYKGAVTRKYAFIYVRVSDQSQVTNFSLDLQVEECRKKARSLGLKVQKVFREEGRSGTNVNRPEYQKMIRMLSEVDNSGEYVLIVYHEDRLHRNEANTFSDMYDLIDNKGIRFVSVLDSLDSDSPDFRYRAGIGAVQAAEFSRNLSKRTHAGQSTAADRCLFLGGVPPYGFTVDTDTGQLALDSLTFKAVKKAFELYADGFSSEDVCSWLTENGYRTIKGNHFKKNTLYGMFKNEKYRGCYTWDKALPKDRNGHRTSNGHKQEYIRVEGGCPRIVSDEVFFRVQERLAENKKKAAGNKPRRYYPFNGMIYCSCGSRMCGEVQYSNGNPYYKYRCYDRCGNKAISADFLEKSILNGISKCLFSVTNTDDTIELLNQFSKEQKELTDSEYKLLRTKEAGLSNAQNNILSVIEKGKSNTALFNRLDQTEQELQEIQHRIKNLERDTVIFDEQNLKVLECEFSDYLQNVKSIENITLLKRVIRKIEIDSDTVNVILTESVSISEKIKSIFTKGSTIMNIERVQETKEVKGIITNLCDGEDGLVRIEMLILTKEKGYSKPFTLDVPYRFFEKFADDGGVDFVDVMGSKVDLKVTYEEDVKAVRICD